MQNSGEEHSTELLKIFSQEAELEMTAALEPAAEKEADDIDFAELHEELEALEKGRHIQQVKLETYGGAYQPGEQLEEARDVPAKELTEEDNLPKEKTKHQLGDETVELKFVVEWQLDATRGDKDNMGDRVDLPTYEKEVQQRRLHKKSQPLEKLDIVIEEIRKLMLRSTEAVSKEEMNRGELAIAAGKKKKKQQHSWRGARGQLQKRIWDPGGFQHWRRGAHDFPSCGV
jgi:hypothetical protein